MRPLPVSVLFVIPSLAYGGAETQLINQINAFNKDPEFFVSLLILSEDDSLLELLELPENRILVIRQPHTFLSFRTIIQSPGIAKEVVDFVVAQHVKVAVANLPFAHFIMRMVKARIQFKGRSFKLINYHHSMQYAESPLNSITKRLFNRFVAWLTRYDDLHVFISRQVSENIKQNIPIRNAMVLHNAVPFNIVNKLLAQQYLTGIPIEPPGYLIVIPGRLNEAKGQLFFIEAFRKFVHICNLKPGQILVVLAGGGNLEEEARNRIKVNSLHSFFHITGFLPNPLILSFLHLADLVVVPSINEGFGIVAIEGLMVGSIILSSNAGGLKDIIRHGDNGFIFESLNEDDLLNKLKFIYKHKSVDVLNRDNLVKEFKNKYSFDKHMVNLKEIIKSCAE